MYVYVCNSNKADSQGLRPRSESDDPQGATLPTTSGTTSATTSRSPSSPEAAGGGGIPAEAVAILGRDAGLGGQLPAGGIPIPRVGHATSPMPLTKPKSCGGSPNPRRRVGAQGLAHTRDAHAVADIAERLLRDLLNISEAWRLCRVESSPFPDLPSSGSVPGEPPAGRPKAGWPGYITTCSV